MYGILTCPSKKISGHCVKNIIPIKITKHVENPSPVATSFGLLNARSVKQKDKPAEIHDLVADNELDILFITETWLQSNSIDELAIGDMTPNGYSLKHLPRPNRRGGGIGLIYRSCLPVAELQPFSATTFECFTSSVSIGDHQITLSVVYKPPKTGASSLFFTELGDLVERLATHPGELILVGDFNFHVDQAADPDARKFLGFLESFNLKQHVSQPTHQKGHTLDLVITKDNGNIIKIIGTDHSVTSDHSCVLFTLNFPKPSKIKRPYLSERISQST